MAHCNHCGMDWIPRVPNPKACTRCKRYDWSEPKKARDDAGRKYQGSAVRSGEVSGHREGVDVGAGPRKPAVRKSALRSVAKVESGPDKGVGGDAEALKPLSIGDIMDIANAKIDAVKREIVVPKHDRAACRVYKCGICAAMGGK